MRQFKTRDEAEKFIIGILNSETWKFIKEVLEDRENGLFQQIGDPTQTSDGRALLNGRLLEIKFLARLPQNLANNLVKPQEEPDDGIEDTIIRKPGEPEVVTH